MTEIRTYPLYVSIYLKLTVFGTLSLFTVIGLFAALGPATGFGDDAPQWFFGIFWLAIVCWLWYVILSLPHTIAVHADDQIEFVSIIRRKRFLPLEIKSIKPEASQFGFLVVQTNRGKVRLLNQFDGFHDFLTNLKSKNPSVELRGC